MRAARLLNRAEEPLTPDPAAFASPLSVLAPGRAGPAGPACRARKVRFDLGAFVVSAGPEPFDPATLEGPAWLPCIDLPLPEPCGPHDPEHTDPPTSRLVDLEGCGAYVNLAGCGPTRPPGAPTRPQPRWA